MGLYITVYHFGGFAHDCSNSCALAMKSLQSCAKPSIWSNSTRCHQSSVDTRINFIRGRCLHHGSLTRYGKLQIAHGPGMPGTFSPTPTSKGTASLRSRHASRHLRHARAVMHVGIANPRWRGKRSRHSRRMNNPQFYVSGKGLLGPRYTYEIVSFLAGWFV